MYIKRRGASLTLSIALQLGEAVIRTASTVDVDTGELQVEKSAVFIKDRVTGRDGVEDIQVAVWKVAFRLPPCPVLVVITILCLQRPRGEMDLHVPKLVSIQELDCPGRPPTPWECTTTSV
jgi:hypothetical protein